MSRHQRILIVDDHPTNIALLEDILGEEYVLAAATSGEEALALVSPFQPDLILLDIMMPGVNGYETCRRLREMPAFRHVKILMVSAKARVEDRLRGYEVGADDYITKPFDEEELLAKVQVYLRLKSVEEVDQLKSNLLAMLSHKTLTPLHGVLAPLNTLLDEETLDAAERQELLQMAIDSAAVLAELVEKITDLSAMKTGTWPFHFFAMDLSEVVTSAIQSVAVLAEARQVTMHIDVPATAPMSLDAQCMVEALSTLLENAIQLSREGGEVAITISPQEDHYDILVEDQGEGMATDMIAQLYDGLGWANGSASPDRQGLKLALARQIIFAHNGLLKIESMQGVGTTYSLSLPFSLATEPQHAHV